MKREETQAYIYLYLFSHKLTSHSGCHTTLSRVLCALSRSLLVIRFKCSRVYMSIPNSLTVPSFHTLPLPQEGKILSQFHVFFLNPTASPDTTATLDHSYSHQTRVQGQPGHKIQFECVKFNNLLLLARRWSFQCT